MIDGLGVPQDLFYKCLISGMCFCSAVPCHVLFPFVVSGSPPPPCGHKLQHWPKDVYIKHKGLTFLEKAHFKPRTRLCTLQKCKFVVCVIHSVWIWYNWPTVPNTASADVRRSPSSQENFKHLKCDPPCVSLLYFKNTFLYILSEYVTYCIVYIWNLHFEYN